MAGSMGRPRRALWITAAAGLAVDQVTKAVAAVAVEGKQPVHALGGGVTFTAFRNSGAAGSFAPHATLVFTVLAVGVLSFITWASSSVRSVGWAVGLGLLFAAPAATSPTGSSATPGSAAAPCWTSSRSVTPGSSTSPTSA